MSEFSFITQHTQHSARLLRLKSDIIYLQGFHAYIVVHNNPDYRDELIKYLYHDGDCIEILDLKILGSYQEFRVALNRLGNTPDIIHIINLESLSNRKQNEFYKGLNYHRDGIGETAKTLLFFWIAEPLLKVFPRHAPDFWAWRSQVLDFVLPTEIPTLWKDRSEEYFNITKEKKKKRISEILVIIDESELPNQKKNDDPNYLGRPTSHIGDILDYLDTHNKGEPNYNIANLWYELGMMYRTLGENEDAKKSLKKAQKVFGQLGDKSTQLQIERKLAELIMLQGDYKSALTKLRSVLSKFKILQNEYEVMETNACIATVLRFQGEGANDKEKLEAAKRLYEETLLPFYQENNNKQKVAEMQWEIANVLRKQGKQDDAMTLFGKVLIKFKELGDSRAVAQTQGSIAGILQFHGKIDEALNIYQNEELPIYEKIGDIRGKALTLDNVASIYYSKGERDKALALWQDEVLPVVKHLGERDSSANLLTQLADILWKSSPKANAECVRDYLVEALSNFKALNLENKIKHVEKKIDEMGLPRKGNINPKIWIDIHDGDSLYPVNYQLIFEEDDANTSQIIAKAANLGLQAINIDYYSGNKKVTLWTGYRLPENPYVEIDYSTFLDLLIRSVSLNAEVEKNRVVEAFPTLSQFQIDELIKVFIDETEKFQKFAEKHPQDIDKLQDKAIRQWIIWEETQITSKNNHRVPRNKPKKM